MHTRCATRPNSKTDRWRCIGVLYIRLLIGGQTRFSTTGRRSSCSTSAFNLAGTHLRWTGWFGEEDPFRIRLTGTRRVQQAIASQWTLGKQDSAFVVAVNQELLREVAADLSIDPSETVLLNRFTVRDARLEHLAWALKAEMDDGFTAGRLFTDSLATTMACHLLKRHSIASPKQETAQPGLMAPFRLRRVLSFIEDNLSGDLSLGAIATVSGLSISHCQRAFVRATGVSLHQFVMRRRVERARTMLADSRMSLSEVAHAVGFSHQSHMALQIRRMLGVSPARIRNGRESHD